MRQLLRRKAATDMHEEAWSSYEGILLSKSIIGASLFLIYQVTQALTGDWERKEESLLEKLDADGQ